MSRQLNLRVSDQFAERLDRVAKRFGQPMATVIESLGTPALEAAEADAQFEAEAFTAWEDFQLTGKHVTSDAITAMFDEALTRSRAVATSDDQ